MRMKTTLRFHFIPVRMAIAMKKQMKNAGKGWARDLYARLVGILVHPLQTPVWKFLKELKLELPHRTQLHHLSV